MTITPQQALDLIDNTLAQINAPREGHRQLLEAVAILRDLVATSNVVPDTGDTLGQ